MELYLIDDKPFSIDRRFSSTEIGERCLVSFKQSFKLEPLACYYFNPLLRASVSFPLLNGTGERDELNPRLKLKVVITYHFLEKRGRLTLCSGNGPSVLEKIRQLCGPDNVRINLKLNKTNSYSVRAVDYFETKDLPIKHFIEEGNPCGYGWEMNNLMLSFLRSTYSTRLTLSVKLTENAMRSLVWQRFGKTNMGGGNKRMLQDAVWSDLTIVAGNGAEIKCHRVILAVRSDVFQTMFENNMKESVTSVLEMREMSEQAVRAFLGFIYYWDMKDAVENCDVALELLVAADMYNVSELKSAIIELVGFMPNEWFNEDMSVKLLIFTERQRGICGNKDFEQVQTQVIRALKSFTKDAIYILLNSQAYQELFRQNPETAKQLTDRIRSFRVKKNKVPFCLPYHQLVSIGSNC